MEYRVGMVLSPPECKHHGRIKPRRIIGIDEERGLLWVCVNRHKANVAYAYPIETFERWTEYEGVNI